MSKISLSALVERPAPGLAVPTQVRFSPDGKWIAWLHSPEKSSVQRLFLYEVATKNLRWVPSPPVTADESTLTDDEVLRRQRLRDYRHGITRYSWTRTNQVVVPASNALWRLDPLEDNWHCLVDAATPIVDPQPSPDGEKAAWVADGELWLQDEHGQRALTTHVADGVTHGLADYIAQEEMHRMHGFWWSPDSRRIAYVEVDERSVPLYRIPRTSADPYDEELHRYPFAGGPNAIAKLFVVDVETHARTQLQLDEFEYLARVDWANAETLYVQTTDRAQKTLRLQACDRDGTRVLLTETSDSWINLHSHLKPLEDGFVWASERSGHMQLEIHDINGAFLRTLSQDGKNVYSVDHVDETKREMFFTADGDCPRERRAYVVALDSGEIRELTPERGTHRVACETKSFVDVHDDLNTPPKVLLRSSSDGRVLATLFDNVDQRIDEYAMIAPEQRTIATGVDLDVSIFRPVGSGPFPTLVHVYGGPGVQMVRDTWAVTAQLDWQYLRERGVCVVTVDNRGSANRGKAFEAAIANDLGNLEVQDQADVLERLVDEGLVDRSRIAVIGASYGGYMAAMCLAQRPDLFRAAIAQAPVSHWDGYDTHYTERYMGLPSQNVEGYERSSLMHHVPGIEGNLLLVHGMLDENVHFRHMARLIGSLIEHRKPYRLLLYPSERHGPVGNDDRLHMKQQTMNFVLDSMEVTQ